MTIYKCNLEMYHDKPVINGIPSSNNGWIYTAYANKLGLYIDKNKLDNTFRLCNLMAKDDDLYFIYRLPDKKTPPISRDEIIGMISLGYNPLIYGWYMYRFRKLYNSNDVLDAMWSIKDKHRNYFWENKVMLVYQIAMKLMRHDRYYINKVSKNKTSIINYVIFNLYAINTIVFGSAGEKNLLWLQLSDLKSKMLIRLINKRKNFLEYFGKDHWFNE